MPCLRYFCYFACVLFSACGGSNGDLNESRGAGIPVRPSNCGGHLPNTGSFALKVRYVDEVEPNDDVSTAYALDMPSPDAPEDLAGIVVQGSVDDMMDRVDTFSFTRSRKRWLFVKLCGLSCVPDSENGNDGNPDSLPVSIGHFNVLNANGELIATTAGHSQTENFGELCIDTGVITYIAVHAYNTLGLVQPYRISVFERDF